MQEAGKPNTDWMTHFDAVLVQHQNLFRFDNPLIISN